MFAVETPGAQVYVLCCRHVASSAVCSNTVLFTCVVASVYVGLRGVVVVAIVFLRTEHQETLTLLQQVQYDAAFLFAYSMRAKTRAYHRCAPVHYTWKNIM